MMTAAMQTPIKIVIPMNEESTKTPSSPTELIQRLQRTPTEKTPDDYDAVYARARALAAVETEAKKQRAARANERVRENVARKLRLEAAAVTRASEKIEKKNHAKSAKQEELEAKRQASAQRSRQLFEAVREAREARQLARDARVAALSELESRAASSKAKRLQSTVAKSAAQVRHAAQVVAAQKEAERQSKESAAAALEARLSAASDRRQDKLDATVEGASSVVAAAERTRLRHLHEERAAVEARRARLATAMARALGRRQGALETIAAKAAASNGRVADAVLEVRRQGDARPALLAHSIAVKMQAAEVSHSLAMRAAAAHAQAKVKAPVVIIIPADNRATALDEPCLPPPRLLERLLFMPKMRLATATARHAAAAGRRSTIRALRVARAAHFGSVRVAVVGGRRAALAEVRRSLDELKERKAAAGRAQGLRRVVAKAAVAGQRVVQAKLRRSAGRLALLNRAIHAEERREAAALGRAITFQNRALGAAAKARANAVEARRAASDKAAKDKGAAAELRAFEVASRRQLHLAGRVAAAKRAVSASRFGAKGSSPAAPAPKPKTASERVAAATAAQVIACALAANLTVEEREARAQARAERVAKAARISDAAAATATAKALAASTEKAAARAVAAAAIAAGLHGSAAAASSSAASSDSEEWQVLPRDPTEARVLREKNN